MRSFPMICSLSWRKCRQGVRVLIADASRPFAPTAGVRCLWEERLATAWAWEGTHARTVRLLTLHA